jgi:dCTP deaminase
MSTLTRDDIKMYLGSDRDLARRLVLRPLLDPEEQIKECGIDLRLNNQFIVFQQQNLSHVDPSNPQLKAKLRRYQTRLIVPFRRGDGLVLHPAQLVLGSTIEYVALPACLEAQVEGRSSWARLGLTVVSASTVAPGFRGVITLELANHGVAPLILWPGVRIANLVLHEVKTPSKYLGEKYVCPIGPEFSKVHDDYDTLFWGQLAMPISVRKPTREEESHMRTWPTWEIEPSEFPWHYDQRETCLLAEGEVTVEAPGQTVSLGPGDCAVFPQGLVCTWKVRTKLRKHYRFG